MGRIRGADPLMRVAFVVPGDSDTISGGYAYDRAMVAGLRAAGHDVSMIAPGEVQALPAETRVVIDGLGLPAFEGREQVLTRPGIVGLIHHPTALETGRDDTSREKLRALEASIYVRLARIIVTSEATAERLVTDFAAARDRIAVVVPGTPDAPRSPGSGGPGCNILSVGTLVPRKGHDMLIRALAALFDLDWRLTIAGSDARDPAHARTLAALVEELGVTSRVRFAGEVNNPALDKLWREADVFALATHFEGYGMAIAEALKRGLPVAVTSGAAAAALVTPGAGAVCQPGDCITFSKSLRRMIFDESLRREMADAAWEIGRGLPDWETQARAFALALEV